jgi:hypothetical protein
MSDKTEITTTLRGVHPKDFHSVVLTVFRNSIIPVLNRHTRRFANEFKDELVFRIASQAFNHQPLNPDYKAGKVAQGLDPRILIATREYLDSIQVTKLIGEYGYRVGVPNRIHSGSNISLRDLARMLEFGTSRMPARPHWRPMASIYHNKAVKMADSVNEDLGQVVMAKLAKT